MHSIYILPPSLHAPTTSLHYYLQSSPPSFLKIINLFLQNNSLTPPRTPPQPQLLLHLSPYSRQSPAAPRPMYNYHARSPSRPPALKLPRPPASERPPKRLREKSPAIKPAAAGLAKQPHQNFKCQLFSRAFRPRVKLFALEHFTAPPTGKKERRGKKGRDKRAPAGESARRCSRLSPAARSCCCRRPRA